VAHNIVIEAVWLPDESDEHAAAETAWARRFLETLEPHRAGGVYVNFLDFDDDSGRVREAYGDRTYRRLAEVKAKYDPDNAFHHNKNIQPEHLAAGSALPTNRPRIQARTRRQPADA
jgi:FAD/FMN-containing dehydrogenase